MNDYELKIQNLTSENYELKRQFKNLKKDKQNLLEEYVNWNIRN